MDQAHKNGGMRDGKDQADKLRMMVQDMQGHEPEDADEQTGEHPPDEGFRPEPGSASASMDIVPDDEDSSANYTPDEEDDDDDAPALREDPSIATISHDDVKVEETDMQAAEAPEQHEEKAEDVMNQDMKVLETEWLAEQASGYGNDGLTEAQEEELQAEGEGNDQREATGEEYIDDAYLNRVIEELCLSKAEEFAMLGYEGVTGKDIWDFVSEKYEQTGVPPLHRLINDILSLRPTQYMNWLTLSAYKGNTFHE